jgi:hypothetical protein
MRNSAEKETPSQTEKDQVALRMTVEALCKEWEGSAEG